MANRLSELPKVLRDVRARLVPLAPAAGETFYGFVGGSAVLDIGTTLNVIVQDEDGGLSIGTYVYNVRPDRQFEVFQTDGQGKVTFYLGPGAKFWPATGKEGPHTVFVSDEGPSGGQPPAAMHSDMVTSLGMPDGHHCDYSITFRRMVHGGTGGPVQPGTLDEALQHLEQALAILRSLRA